MPSADGSLPRDPRGRPTKLGAGAPEAPPARAPGAAGDLIAKLRAAHPEVAYGVTPKGTSHYRPAGRSALTPPVVNIGEYHADLPHILAHELGHHEFHATPLGRATQSTPVRLLGGQAVPLSMLGGIAAARSDSKFAPYLAAAIPALTNGSALLSEAMANHRGYQALKRVGASPQAMRAARRDLAGAFGTYVFRGALSAGAAAAPFAVKKYWRAHHPPSEPVKQADLDELTPGDRHPILKRLAQGTLGGGALGAASGVALGALAPRIFGRSDSRVAGALRGAASLGVAGAAMGASGGQALGAYEAGRRHGETGRGYDPRLLSLLSLNPVGLAAGHMGEIDARGAPTPSSRRAKRATLALETKTFGPLTFRIDRPKGTVKKWPTKTFVYPCDYGYFPRLKGEDGEGLDAFVGDHPAGHLESFLKLKPDAKGRLVPDETKFLVGVTDQEREVIYRLYGAEVVNRKVYATVADLERDLARFRPAHKGRYGASAKAAAFRDPVADASAIYGVKRADIDKILKGLVTFSDLGDATTPARAHVPEAAVGDDRRDRAWKSFDDRNRAVGAGAEAAGATPFQEGVVG